MGTFGANRFDLPWDPNDVNVPPNNIDVGENIKVAATSVDTISMDSLRYSVYTEWSEKEAAFYSFGGAAGTSSNGHFTQVAWAKTQYVGCGFCGSGDCGCGHGYMFTCNYWPAGNGGSNVYKQGNTCSCCEDGRTLCTTGENAGLCTDSIVTAPNPTPKPTPKPTSNPTEPKPTCVKLTSIDTNKAPIFNLAQGVYNEFIFKFNNREVYIWSSGWWSFFILWDGLQWVVSSKPGDTEYDYALCDSYDILECGWTAGQYSMNDNINSNTIIGTTTNVNPNASATDNCLPGGRSAQAFFDENVNTDPLPQEQDNKNETDNHWMQMRAVYAIVIAAILLIVAGNVVFCYYMKRKMLNKQMERVLDENEINEKEEDVETQGITN